MYQSKYVLRKDYLFVYDANHILADLVNAKRVRERAKERKREREKEREREREDGKDANYFQLVKIQVSVNQIVTFS